MVYSVLAIADSKMEHYCLSAETDNCSVGLDNKGVEETEVVAGDVGHTAGLEVSGSVDLVCVRLQAFVVVEEQDLGLAWIWSDPEAAVLRVEVGVKSSGSWSHDEKADACYELPECGLGQSGCSSVPWVMVVAAGGRMKSLPWVRPAE